jgi:hypothetical protein
MHGLPPNGGKAVNFVRAQAGIKWVLREDAKLLASELLLSVRQCLKLLPELFRRLIAVFHTNTRSLGKGR